jgi:hypothetical protein
MDSFPADLKYELERIALQVSFLQNLIQSMLNANPTKYEIKHCWQYRFGDYDLERFMNCNGNLNIDAVVNWVLLLTKEKEQSQEMLRLFGSLSSDWSCLLPTEFYINVDINLPNELLTIIKQYAWETGNDAKQRLLYCLVNKTMPATIVFQRAVKKPTNSCILL